MNECAWHGDCISFCLHQVVGVAFFAADLGRGESSGRTDMKTALRIAVADTEAEIRRFLYRTLTHEGHRVIVVAENGRQLVDECRESRPDLVITDIEMPEKDGLTAIHEIGIIAPVPAIIITAHSGREVLMRASQELVFAILIKPIRMDDLPPAIWMTMHRYCEVRALRQRLETPGSA